MVSAYSQLSQPSVCISSLDLETNSSRLEGKNVDPQILIREGQIAITQAIAQKNWKACKDLIDDGIPLTDKQKEDIQCQLKTYGLFGSDAKLFMNPCPKPYDLEVYFEGKFEPLAKVASRLNLGKSQGIALFNVADEPLGRFYGNVMGIYKNNNSFNEKCAQLAEKQIVVRVRVDEVSQLGRTIQKIGQFLPTYFPVTSWTLIGHSNSDLIQVGSNSLLTRENTVVMEEVANLIDPAAPIILHGCGTAEGDDNITRVFSQYAPGHLVMGAPEDVTEVHYSVVQPRSPFPRLMPMYLNIVDGGMKDQLKGYMNNRLVIDETMSASENMDNNFDQDNVHPLKLKVAELMSKESVTNPQEIGEEASGLITRSDLT